jgi:hypothetical protein
MHTNEDKKVDLDFLGEQEKTKNSGMRLPDGYWDEFEEQMLSKIQDDRNENIVPSINRWTRVVSVITLAASLLWGGLFLFNNPSNIKDDVIAEKITEEIEFYELDEYAMVENLTNEELEDLYTDEEYITADEAYAYILDENYSEYILLENL